MDIQDALVTYSFPLALAVVMLATWAAVKRLILAHHYNAITGSLFAGLAYLAADEGRWPLAALFAAVAAGDFRRYARLRPQPLDGSHEAL